MDEVDRANDEAERHLLEALRMNRKELQPGQPGECDFCGEWSGRLIDGYCAPCRDRYGLA